jgi:rubredoxin
MMARADGPPYQCPVCGYPGLDEPPRLEERYPSYEICPSCGFEFGVTDDDRGFSYEQWRQEWVNDGMRWWSRARHQPPGWDPRAQLGTVL